MEIKKTYKIRNIDQAVKFTNVKAEWVTTTTVVVTETTERAEEFNWLKCLRALASGELSVPAGSELSYHLRRLAGNWPTCACGQLCTTLARGSLGAPVDPTLRALGLTFLNKVEQSDWRNALIAFEAIEARSSHLLKLGFRVGPLM